MKDETYDLAFVGATVFTCAGIQVLEPQYQCLVIEEGKSVGYEYALAYKGESREINRIEKTCETDSLCRELIARNVLAESGAVHFPALLPVLSNRMCASGATCLFRSRIVAIEPVDHRWQLTLFTPSGFLSINTRRIVDTTAEFSTARFLDVELPQFGRKSLNCYLVSPRSRPWPNREDILYEKGRYGDDIFLHISIPDKLRMNEALKYVYDYWSEYSAFFPGWKIASVATVFDVTPTLTGLKIGETMSYLPSAAYDNFIEAYQAGISFALTSVREDL
jgi:hypothetical protein